jgi:hypothetical protein
VAKLIAARGRLCAGRVWAGKSGACGRVGGLGPVFGCLPARPGLWGHLGPSLRPAGAAPNLPLPVGCRSRLPLRLWGLLRLSCARGADRVDDARRLLSVRRPYASAVPVVGLASVQTP